MTHAVPNKARSEQSADILRHYSTDAVTRKYTKDTAGHGINYLLDHEYGRIYLEVIERYIPSSRLQHGIRLLEIGCGGGMNLLHLVSALDRRGIAVERAYGTDFSASLIEAARRETAEQLLPAQQAKVRFCVARHENLIQDAAAGLGIGTNDLVGAVDIVLGVNTIRFCHLGRNEDKCAGALFDLLTDGGLCIIIDMNRKFPAFRSRLRDLLTKGKGAGYLPSLDEYARPFASAGFEILTKKNFCWIPHSAGPALTAVMKTITPVLDAVVPSYATRSLVISRKPGQARP